MFGRRDIQFIMLTPGALQENNHADIDDYDWLAVLRRPEHPSQHPRMIVSPDNFRHTFYIVHPDYMRAGHDHDSDAREKYAIYRELLEGDPSGGYMSSEAVGVKPRHIRLWSRVQRHYANRQLTLAELEGGPRPRRRGERRRTFIE